MSLQQVVQSFCLYGFSHHTIVKLLLFSHGNVFASFKHGKKDSSEMMRSVKVYFDNWNSQLWCKIMLLLSLFVNLTNRPNEMFNVNFFTWTVCLIIFVWCWKFAPVNMSHHFWDRRNPDLRRSHTEVKLLCNIWKKKKFNKQA